MCLTWKAVNSNFQHLKTNVNKSGSIYKGKTKWGKLEAVAATTTREKIY